MLAVLVFLTSYCAADAQGLPLYRDKTSLEQRIHSEPDLFSLEIHLGLESPSGIFGFGFGLFLIPDYFELVAATGLGPSEQFNAAGGIRWHFVRFEHSSLIAGLRYQYNRMMQLDFHSHFVVPEIGYCWQQGSSSRFILSTGLRFRVADRLDDSSVLLGPETNTKFVEQALDEQFPLYPYILLTWSKGFF